MTLFIIVGTKIAAKNNTNIAENANITKMSHCDNSSCFFSIVIEKIQTKALQKTLLVLLFSGQDKRSKTKRPSTLKIPYCRAQKMSTSLLEIQ